MHSLSNGIILNNKYEIIRKISNGGFGITYEARHKILNHKVAIKEFFLNKTCKRSDNGLDVETTDNGFAYFKERFLREAKRLNKLSHRNIVHIFDFFEENKTAYMVMDYIDGKTLNSYIKSKLSETQVRKYLNQLLDAVKYVHTNGIYHLDIKPANIMINKEDNLILIDFGASKIYDSNSDLSYSTNTKFPYTPAYAPIELHHATSIKELGTYTDVYSIGATIFALFNGAHPTAPDILTQETPKLPKDIANKLSLQMLNVIEKAMIFKYRERIQNIDEFKKLLESPIKTVSATEKGPISTKKKTKIYTKSPIQSTKKAFSAVAFILAICIGIGVIYYNWNNHSSATPSTTGSDTIDSTIVTDTTNTLGSSNTPENNEKETENRTEEGNINKSSNGNNNNNISSTKAVGKKTKNETGGGNINTGTSNSTPPAGTPPIKIPTAPVPPIKIPTAPVPPIKIPTAPVP